jgi:hypothetical protein
MQDPNTGKFAIRGEISLSCFCCALWTENLGKGAEAHNKREGFLCDNTLAILAALCYNEIV